MILSRCNIIIPFFVTLFDDKRSIIKQNGNASCFMNTNQYNRCVDAHADSLYRFIVGVVRQQAVAEDVVQESFTRLWQNRTKVENGKEKSYLFTIAYRLAISELRTRKRDSSGELPLTHFVATNEYDNMTELLWQALDRLRERERTVLMLSDWEGYSYREITQITELTEAQVKIIIHRARSTIREQLQNEYRR